MAMVQVTPESSAEDTFSVMQIFYKFILKASLIAIPLYLGLFIAAIPFDVNAGFERGLMLATPVVEFVAAAIIYSAGFLITPSDINQESLDSFRRLKSKIIRRKMKFLLFGSVPFIIGILSGTLLLIKAHL